MCKCRRERQKKAFQLRLHTYMNDVWIGVLIVGADKKVNQKLSPVFLVQLGNDILQPPRFALRRGNELKLKRNKMPARKSSEVGGAWEYFTEIGLPVVDS